MNIRELSREELMMIKLKGSKPPNTMLIYLMHGQLVIIDEPPYIYIVEKQKSGYTGYYDKRTGTESSIIDEFVNNKCLISDVFIPYHSACDSIYDIIFDMLSE